MRGRPYARTARRTALLLALSCPGPLAGQVPADTSPRVLRPGPGIFAGTRQEEFLRTLQLLGAVSVHQLSVRALGPRELDQLAVTSGSVLPGSIRRGICGVSCEPVARMHAGVLPPEASLWFNSTRPYGMNDGVVWAGRGVTLAASGGVFAQAGPVSAVIAPVVTWAQNQAFALEPNGRDDTLRYGDAFFPTSIDKPQRFGDAAYTRVNMGESTVRLDMVGAAAGISTASQWWGPMQLYPYLLSNNAGGFPHVFAGTSQPANIGIGGLHVKVMYGRLGESDYTVTPDSARRRLASGLVAVFMPRGLPGLEVGGARFFHSTWPSGGVSGADLAKPFEGFLKASAFGRDPEGGLIDDVHNQLASVFARLVVPASGLEVYAEFGREDHNADLRDFWLQPDHDAVYGIGVRRAWSRGPGAASQFAAEFMNARFSHLQNVRPQVVPYLHGRLTQGHTSEGQVLGSATGARSGEALTMSYTRYGDSFTRYSLSRQGEADRGIGSDRLVRLLAQVEHGFSRGPLEIAGAIGLMTRIGRAEATGGTNVNLSLQTRWTPDQP